MRFAPAHAKTVFHLHKMRVHDPIHEFHFSLYLRSISLTGSEGCVWLYKISDLASSKHQFLVLMMAGVRVAHLRAVDMLPVRWFTVVFPNFYPMEGPLP
jgi:hypothetical protein